MVKATKPKVPPTKAEQIEGWIKELPWKIIILAAAIAIVAAVVISGCTKQDREAFRSGLFGTQEKTPNTN